MQRVADLARSVSFLYVGYMKEYIRIKKKYKQNNKKKVIK
jgi:hypothetical protein